MYSWFCGFCVLGMALANSWVFCAEDTFEAQATRLLEEVKKDNLGDITPWPKYDGVGILKVKVTQNAHIVLPLLRDDEAYSRILAIYLLTHSGQRIDDKIAGYLLALIVDDSSRTVGLCVLNAVRVLECDPWFRKQILSQASRSKHESVAVMASKMAMDQLLSPPSLSRPRPPAPLKDADPSGRGDNPQTPPAHSPDRSPSGG